MADKGNPFAECPTYREVVPEIGTSEWVEYYDPREMNVDELVAAAMDPATGQPMADTRRVSGIAANLIVGWSATDRKTGEPLPAPQGDAGIVRRARGAYATKVLARFAAAQQPVQSDPNSSAPSTE